MAIDAGDISSAAESARQQAAAEFAEKIKARRAASAEPPADINPNPDGVVLDAGADIEAGEGTDVANFELRKKEEALAEARRLSSEIFDKHTEIVTAAESVKTLDDINRAKSLLAEYRGLDLNHYHDVLKDAGMPAADIQAIIEERSRISDQLEDLVLGVEKKLSVAEAGSPPSPDTEASRETPEQIYTQIINEIDRNDIGIKQILRSPDLNDSGLAEADNALRTIGENLPKISPDLLEQLGGFNSDYLNYLKNLYYHGNALRIKQARERLATERAAAGAGARGAGGETDEQRQAREANERCASLGREINVTLSDFYRLANSREITDREAVEMRTLRDSFTELTRDFIGFYKKAGASDASIQERETARRDALIEMQGKIDDVDRKLAEDRIHRGAADTSPSGDARTERERRQAVAQKLAEVKGYESDVRQILAGRREIIKGEFDHYYNRFQQTIGEMASLELTEKEMGKLAEYRQMLADYRIQAIARGVLGAEDLDEARAAVAVAQKRIEDLQKISIGLLSFVRRGSRQKIEEESRKAQEVYQEKLKEATLADRGVMLNERMKLVEARLAAYRGGRETKTLYEKYKGLSEINLDNWLQKRGTNLADIKYVGKALKVGARIVNVKTAVSIGLFGGMIASGAYLGVGAGIAVARLRGAWSGIGAGAGTYEVTNLARRAMSEKLSDKQISELDDNQIIRHMAFYEARATLDGTDLKSHVEYQKMVARHKAIMEIRSKDGTGAEMNGEMLYENLVGALRIEDLAKRDKLGRERWVRRGAFIAGAVVGGTMYNWIVNKALAAAEAKGVADAAEISALRGVSKGADTVLSKPSEIGPDALSEKFRSAMAGMETKSPTLTGIESEIPKPSSGSVTAAAKEAIASRAGKITEVPLRAGASIEFGSAGDAIVHAGKRGIEGAFLDMAHGDDQTQKLFSKSVVWLGEKYPELKDNPDGLIDKFIREVAEKKGMTVGDMGTNDLNRILKGALHINSDAGEITLGDVNFMPHKVVEVASNLDHPTGMGATSAIAEHTQTPSVPSEVGFSPRSIPKPEGLDATYVHDASDATDAAREHAEQSAQDVVVGKSDKVVSAYEVVRQAGQEVRNKYAINMVAKGKKISEALKVVTGEGYNKFLNNTLGVSARMLNGLKEMTVDQYLEKINSHALDSDKFFKLTKYLKAEKALWSIGGIGSKNLKDVILTLAIESKH